MDLRKSNFKKVGKLLEHMSSNGAIVYAENKVKGHKLITQVVVRACDFVPQFKLKHTKRKAEEQKQASEE